MVPEGWGEHRFGEIVRLANGQVDPKTEPYASMPHIGPENIQSGTGELSGVKSAAECGVISGKYEFDEHALVYSKIRPNLNKVAQPGYSGICSADMYPIWGIDGVANTDFLLHFMLSSHFVGAATAVSLRTGMPKINRPDLSAIRVHLPPLLEQRKIAEILSTWDRAIEVSEALLATARTQKRTLMQSLLTGKRRFPEFEGQEWKEVKLGDVLKEVRRPVEWSDDYLYKLISVRRRSGGLFHRENLYGRDIKTKTLKHALGGDFLISKMQVVHGAMALVRDEFNGMQISGSYIAVNSKNPNTLNIEFFDWLSRMPEMYHRAYLCSYGVHIEKMTFNFNLFLKEIIAIPPSAEEQERIVDVLNCAEAEERQLDSHIKHLRTEKKALMQQLLTGKRRVVVDA